MEPNLGEAFHKLVIFSFPSNLDLEATVKCCKCVIFSRTWSISGSVVEKKCGGTTQIIPPTQLMHQTHNHACFVFLFFFVFARLDVVPFCLWRKYGFVKSMAVSREEGPQITLCMEHQQTPIYAHKQKRKQKVYLSQGRGWHRPLSLLTNGLWERKYNQRWLHFLKCQCWQQTELYLLGENLRKDLS